MKHRILIAALTFISTQAAHAGVIQLDWDAPGVNWTAGVLTQSFDIDPSNPGDDIRITLNPGTGGNAATFAAGSPFETILGGSPNGPELAWDVLDLSSSRTVTITISFLYAAGVSNVSFIANDIDTPLADHAEEITSVFGRFQGGANLAATSITPGVNQIVSGTGLNQVLQSTGIANSTTTDSNALFQFAVTLDEISFTFARQNSNNGNLNSLMRLDSIQFDNGDAVPEPGTYLLAMASLTGIIFFKRRGGRN